MTKLELEGNIAFWLYHGQELYFEWYEGHQTPCEWIPDIPPFAAWVKKTREEHEKEERED